MLTPLPFSILPPHLFSRLTSVALLTTCHPTYPSFLWRFCESIESWFPHYFARDAVDRPLLILPLFFSLFTSCLSLLTHSGSHYDFQHELHSHLYNCPVENLVSDFSCVSKHLRLKQNVLTLSGLKPRFVFSFFFLSFFFVKQIIAVAKTYLLVTLPQARNIRMVLGFCFMPLLICFVCIIIAKCSHVILWLIIAFLPVTAGSLFTPFLFVFCAWGLLQLTECSVRRLTGTS